MLETETETEAIVTYAQREDKKTTETIERRVTQIAKMYPVILKICTIGLFNKMGMAYPRFRNRGAHRHIRVQKSEEREKGRKGGALAPPPWPIPMQDEHTHKPSIRRTYILWCTQIRQMANKGLRPLKLKPEHAYRDSERQTDGPATKTEETTLASCAILPAKP